MNLLSLTTDLTMAPTVALLGPQPVDECSGGTYGNEGGYNREQRQRWQRPLKQMRQGW
jgi:hypothetical protein